MATYEMATDLDTRFLEEIGEPMLVVQKHDITVEELAAAQFDAGAYSLVTPSSPRTEACAITDGSSWVNM